MWCASLWKGTMLTLEPKIIIGNKIIFSQYSRRVQKRNSYTVAFADPEILTCIKYGPIKCFLTCPADSADNIHLAVVEGLEVSSCNELLRLSYLPEIQSLASILSSDYVTVIGEGPYLAIPIEHIIIKCFDISTTGLSVITTLVSDCEVLL